MHGLQPGCEKMNCLPKPHHEVDHEHSFEDKVDDVAIGSAYSDRVGSSAKTSARREYPPLTSHIEDTQPPPLMLGWIECKIQSSYRSLPQLFQNYSKRSSGGYLAAFCLIRPFSIVGSGSNQSSLLAAFPNSELKCG